MGRLRISNVRFTPCGAADRAKGIRGWVSLTIDGQWRFDGICLRRRADGDHCISFPARKSSAGAEFPYFKPLDRALRAEVEEAILNHLAQAGGAS